MIERTPRRRPYQPGGRPIRLSVTLTEEEHRRLGELAQQRGVSIATLLVDSALQRLSRGERSSSRSSTT